MHTNVLLHNTNYVIHYLTDIKRATPCSLVDFIFYVSFHRTQDCTQEKILNYRLCTQRKSWLGVDTKERELCRGRTGQSEPTMVDNVRSAPRRVGPGYRPTNHETVPRTRQDKFTKARLDKFMEPCNDGMKLGPPQEPLEAFSFVETQHRYC